MTESQRLIAELSHIQSFFEAKADMSVGNGVMLLLNWANVARDAAALIEHDPVTPYIGHGFDDREIRLRCGGCRQAIDNEDAYCRHCGRRVQRWNDISTSSSGEA